LLHDWFKIILVVFFLFLVEIQSANAQMMQSKEIRAYIQQAAHAWETGNSQAFAQLFAPDGIFVVPGQCWQGQAEIATAMEAATAQNPEIKITISKIISEENAAVVEWRWESQTVDGEKMVADDAIVIEFRDQQITRWREYIDRQTP
jgi:uncharacterized protein (TIGR02246 family)